MHQIVLVCGNWIEEKKRWLFHVDQKRGSKIISANDDTRYGDFVRLVIEDYKIEWRFYDLELSYMVPKKILVKLPQKTPPVKVENSRQLQEFLQQLKVEPIRLCVELKEKTSGDKGASSSKHVPKDVVIDSDMHAKYVKPKGVTDGENKKWTTNEVTTPSDNLDIDDDNDRFDFCDDSDGASSGDEDFSLYRMSPEEDDAKQNLPITERESTTVTKEAKRVQPHISLDMLSLNLAVGQQFASKDALETRLKVLSVIHQFDFDVDRSKPDLLLVKCWLEGCSWRLRATPIGDSPQFYIRVYVAEHSCSVTERSTRSRQATPDILALLYKDYVGSVGPKVLPRHVGDAMTMRFGIKMDYWKARRTLLEARNLVRGSPESGYADLPKYVYMIRRANPGTLTRLEVDNSGRFKYLFLAFGGSMNGFPFMRKVIVVDGTFLKGKYKGTLLTASAQDGNFQIFPIAFAVVDTENDESWEWFFRQLNYVIPDDEGLALISDRHKAIRNAIGKVYPMASRGICTYHLYKNILVRFGGGEAFRLVKKAANSYRIVDFETTFDEIKGLNPSLHKYLQEADVKKWARAHFPGDRYNITTSNIAESINKVLSDARSLPIVQLLDAIRLMMTRWFAARRDAAELTKTTLTRGVEKLLEARIPYAKLLKVQAIDTNQAQVTGSTSLHVVNLTEKKCSCRRFNLEKIPCVHAIAAAESRKVSSISLCHPFYQKMYLYNAYKTAIMPTDDGLHVPEHVATAVCLPPEVRQPPGRPKNSRAKSALEKATVKKRPRKSHACSICNQVGHNCKTCPTL